MDLGFVVCCARVACGDVTAIPSLGMRMAEASAPAHMRPGIRMARQAYGLATMDFAAPSGRDVDISALELVPARDLVDKDAKAVLVIAGVSVNDVAQGHVGDCWLLSGLILLATRGDLLRPLFVKADLEKGEYTLRFFKNGQVVEVEVDDKLPCLPVADDKPAWARIATAHSATPGEMWLSIVEKAYAQLHGGYQNLQGGSLSEALEDLTGGHAHELVVGNINECVRTRRVWKFIEEARRERWPLGCTMWSAQHARADKEIVNESIGLAFNHAYAIIDAREVRVGDTILQFVKMRNPWGYGEWKGAYGDHDDAVWTPELLAALEHKRGDDGEFFMTIDDFCAYFTHVQTVRLLNDMYGSKWVSTKASGEWTVSETSGIYKLTVNVPASVSPTEGVRVVVALSKHDRRGDAAVTSDEDTVAPRDVAIALGVALNGQRTHDSDFVVRRSVSLDFTLAPPPGGSGGDVELVVDARALVLSEAHQYDVYAYAEKGAVALERAEEARATLLSDSDLIDEASVSVGVDDCYLERTHGRTSELESLEKAIQSAKVLSVVAAKRGVGLSHVLQVATRRVLGTCRTFRAVAIDARKFDPQRWWVPLLGAVALSVSKMDGVAHDHVAKSTVKALHLLEGQGALDDEELAKRSSAAFTSAFAALDASASDDASKSSEERLLALIGAVGTRLGAAEAAGRLLVTVEGAETLSVEAVKALAAVGSSNDGVCVIVAFGDGECDGSNACGADVSVRVVTLDIDSGVAALQDTLGAHVSAGLDSEAKLDAGSRTVLRKFFEQERGNLVSALKQFSTAMQAGIIEVVDEPRNAADTMAVSAAMAKLNICGALGHLRNLPALEECTGLLQEALKKLSALESDARRGATMTAIEKRAAPASKQGVVEVPAAAAVADKSASGEVKSTEKLKKKSSLRRLASRLSKSDKMKNMAKSALKDAVESSME